ncbi:tyrosine-type recombinase/integrase [Planotetraspora phitsanulokensis]|uniref:Tyr recombinase domain-containing protein n=1 Tax=Planotetraspora phitsanulokensis TaxID=575192 RepID=A0A8J3U9S9_9ACTN|nr:site-specific integrase [Planotetraspora phitsanulokensis]GII40915.1 hypothetical protein Pph01_59180 [Planotetraspora phitsanulokensis]
MGFITKTKAGTWRANWRDEVGRQRAKTFRTKREADAFLSEVGTALNRGTYIDPHAAKRKFGPYAGTWMLSRNHEITTVARDDSIMRTHVLPRWQETPLGKIDYMAVQTWVSDLGKRLSPATVAECHRLLSVVLKAAVRDRIIGTNPAEGVRLPKRRRKAGDDRIISRDELAVLLQHAPDRYRALVALAAGCGLRWGEATGLRWDAVDLDTRTLKVVRVAVEVAGHVTSKPYPKSKAGRREVPLPQFVAELLAAHKVVYMPGPLGEVFTNTAGGPVRRTLFRSRVWRPALVRAGLVGSVLKTASGAFVAVWQDKDGSEHSKDFLTEAEAIACVATNAGEALRFHDLRHCYATWLISDRVPVNDVARLVGHEQISTTLNLYTHGTDERYGRARAAFADFSLTSITTEQAKPAQEPPAGETAAD